MSFIGATGLDEVQEQFDTLNDKIDANADYINNLVGIPDPTHTAIFGINILNPGLFGLVERAEVNIAALQTGEEGLTAQIEAIDTQIAGIEGEITGIQGEIAGIQGEITGIQGEITGIQFTEIPALSGAISAVAGVAGDALVKANKSLGIWDEDGNNTYNMKSGNVGIGILPKGTILNNKLEVAGNINIPTGSKYKINNVDLSYNDLTNKLTAGTNISIVGNAINNTLPFTTIAHDIFTTNLNNFGIGNTLPAQKLDVNGSINIALGSKYKINNIDLSYNDLTNKLTAGDRITIANNVITAEAPYASEQYSGRIPIREYGTGVLNYPANFAFTLDGITIKKSTLQPDVPNNVIYVPQPDWNQDIIGGSGYIYNKPTLFDGNYNSLTNKLTAGTNISIISGAINNTLTAGTNISIVSGAINNTLTAGNNISIVSGAINNTLTAGTNISIVGNAINNTLPITTNVNDIYTTNTGNVGIGTSILNNKLEVAGNLNISAGSKYKINNVNLAFADLGGTLSYNSLTDKLTAGNNISIVGNAINNTLTAGTNISIVSGAINNTLTAGTNISIVSGAINNTLTAGTNISIVSGAINNTYTYTLPTAGVGAGGNLGGVKVDGSTITITNGIISSTSTASGADIFLDGSTNNRSYGWTGSTGLLGRVGVAGNYSTGSAVEDVVLRSQGKLILQSGITNPAMVIDTTNNAFFRNAVGIGTSTIAANNILDIGGVFRVGNNVPLYSFLVSNITGNVGMGTTAETDAKLHLHKAGASLIKIHFTDGFTGTASTNGLTIYKSSTDEGYFWNYQNKPLIFGTNNLERLRISGGDVGIGTTSPSSRLHLHNTLSNQNVSLQITDASTLLGGLILNKSTNNNGYLVNYENAALLFGTNLLERMRISADGNVGIGMTNPVYRCHIKTTYDNIATGLHLDADDSTPASQPNRYALTLYPYVAGSGAVGWRFRTQSITGGTNTPLQFDASGNVAMPEILQIGTLTGGAFNSTIRLRVYASDNSGTAAIFKHPNDTQGLGIRYNEIFQTNTTSDAFNITSTGTGGLRLNTGGSSRLTIGSTGVVSFTTFTWHGCLNGNQRFYFSPSNTTYLRGHGTNAIELRNGGDNTLVRFNNSDIQYFNGNVGEVAKLDNSGNWYCNLVSFSGSGHDWVGVADVNTSSLQNNYRVLRGMISTFTGYHRCYVEDELFNEEDVDIFRNEYMGRIVISTGKIKTDMTLKREGDEDHKWYSLEGKEGITIEDALPIVQLSRNRKDKRVYGVLGDHKRSSNNKCRITINGCGEGAICVANTNGNIENGDYIQTSDLLGYGEKQDDDLHRNYTIAKAVMDCNFELDNPNYECKELASGVRVAMIACVYKAS